MPIGIIFVGKLNVILCTTSLINFYKLYLTLIKHTGFVCWYHIFDVDECILATSSLKSFQCFLNKVADILSFLLTIVYAIPRVLCNQQNNSCKYIYLYSILLKFTWVLTISVFKDVQYRQNLSVVWNKRFTNNVCWHYQMLQNFQCCTDNLIIKFDINNMARILI